MEIVCFCHLRWKFVYQRPQHLLTRFARQGTVHLWEEPEFHDVAVPALKTEVTAEGIRIVTPVLPWGMSEERTLETQRDLLDEYVAAHAGAKFVAWYYTPMALSFSGHLRPAAVVYDCMDELSAFQGAPAAMVAEEERLFERADVVFAGGASLYASKKKQHPNVHLFPSSIDFDHFATARGVLPEPADQAGIAHPRIGFYGVLDERLDRDLLQQTAAAHPEWQFILIGPMAKMREEDLPRGENLHYLGAKSYPELPSYLSGWDVAILPFARNASTRFISPTKTPEYLAGGKPVVSTSITDVATPYGEMGLVHIGDHSEEFAAGITRALQGEGAAWRERVDAFLRENSWDKTFAAMSAEIQRVTSRTLNASHHEIKSIEESQAYV